MAVTAIEKGGLHLKMDQNLEIPRTAGYLIKTVGKTGQGRDVAGDPKSPDEPDDHDDKGRWYGRRRKAKGKGDGRSYYNTRPEQSRSQTTQEAYSNNKYPFSINQHFQSHLPHSPTTVLKKKNDIRSTMCMNVNTARRQPPCRARFLRRGAVIPTELATHQYPVGYHPNSRRIVGNRVGELYVAARRTYPLRGRAGGLTRSIAFGGL